MRRTAGSGAVQDQEVTYNAFSIVEPVVRPPPAAPVEKTGCRVWQACWVHAETRHTQPWHGKGNIRCAAACEAKWRRYSIAAARYRRTRGQGGRTIMLLFSDGAGAPGRRVPREQQVSAARERVMDARMLKITEGHVRVMFNWRRW